jgi:cellulose synthase/poly-beta-1,6-N-acetylglucosamine synthase-like glycosyltransferase
MPKIYKEKVLILTPVKDAAELAETYKTNLNSLSYPHDLISVGVLESDSRDDSGLIFRELMQDLNSSFRRTGFWQKNFDFRIPPNTPRWAEEIQPRRRAVLARGRNHLLFHALDDEDWVLWLDVDVIEYPPDIIERLLSYGKDILQPHCVLEYGGRTFDRNGWRGRGRYFLDDLRREGELVRLDAVGGTMLLIRADLHRDGLIFPPYYYGIASRLARRKTLLHPGARSGEIETEGLGMMAADMSLPCWGLPHLEIKHRDK